VKLRFGDCALDSTARTLFHRGREVHLAPKAYEVLAVLVDGRPRALSKAELLGRVWPGVFVGDDSVAKVVSQLRKAIGDDDRAPIIRTVHGYGYAFVATVESDGAPAPARDAGRAVCWLFCGNREFPLGDGEHVIGRTADADICLESPKVSRRHARLVVDGTRATIEDLGSKNGSFVKGVRISTPTRLAAGDEASIGPFRLRFHIASEAGSTDTEVVGR
jgi:DNA-binding winged helix-turn-helix (wHTH) protein